MDCVAIAEDKIFPRAKKRIQLKAGCGKPHVRYDEQGVETDLRHYERETDGVKTRIPDSKGTRHPLIYIRVYSHKFGLN